MLVQKCMREAGFEYTIEPADPVPGARDFPYVLDDIEWAGQHGYGSDIQRATDEWTKNNPNTRYLQSLSAQRRKSAAAALNGPVPQGLTARTPDGVTFTHSDRGCESTARRRLYGDLPAWYQAKTAVAALADMTVAAVKADQAFTSSVTVWSACMTAAGTPYETPDRVRETLPPPDRPWPVAEEKRLAVTEATCAINSGLARTAKELGARHRALLEEKYRDDVTTKKRLQRQALPRARAVTDDANQ
ncbi:hypothetical protein [Amycolatopsis plumensis]|uniref:Uncharacterized protein n=2 Tax=Amycolatopsis plumensis TaxID=236508 RepID=A0ABV5U3W3_9PSEU